MKRIISTLGMSAALFAVALLPATASASQQRHHRHHHRAAPARLKSFGTASVTAPATDNAGTVTSFTGGVLTIKLQDGTSVSGKVTTATELKCEAAGAVTMARVADNGGGNGGSVSGDGHNGPGSGDNQSQSTPTTSTESDDNGQDVGDADETAPPAGEQPGTTGGGQTCDASLLKEGAAVRHAELSITSAGAVFAEVELVV